MLLRRTNNKYRSRFKIHHWWSVIALIPKAGTNVGNREGILNVGELFLVVLMMLGRTDLVLAFFLIHCICKMSKARVQLHLWEVKIGLECQNTLSFQGIWETLVFNTIEYLVWFPFCFLFIRVQNLVNATHVYWLVSYRLYMISVARTLCSYYFD